MPAFGDLGKFFLGGASTKDVFTAAAAAFTNDPLKAAAIGNAAQRGADLLSASEGQLGQQTATSQAPPRTATENIDSGQDSVTTTFNYGIQPAVLRSGDFFPNQQMMNPNIQPALLRPGLQLGVGAVGALIDLFFIDPVTGERKRKRITRKFKSEVKQAVQLLGIEAVAQMLEVKEEVIVQILLKRFRNDGPYITKAAVRKTRTTVRKMERVNELSKEIAKMAGTTTRRTTRRSAAGGGTSRKTNAIAIN